jgi:hypothetical protein
MQEYQVIMKQSVNFRNVYKYKMGDIISTLELTMRKSLDMVNANIGEYS